MTPEPWIPSIIQAIGGSRNRGLTIPIVYNSSGFITPESLDSLDGMVDIYITDLRYENREQAAMFSGSGAYFDVCREAVRIMNDQVGSLRVDRHGIARRGLIVRVLVIPSLLGAAKSCLDFIARELPGDIHLSLMGQFEPVYRSMDNAAISRRVEGVEYLRILRYARGLNLNTGWRQSPGPPAPGLLGTTMRSDIPGL